MLLKLFPGRMGNRGEGMVMGGRKIRMGGKRMLNYVNGSE